GRARASAEAQSYSVQARHREPSTLQDARNASFSESMRALVIDYLLRAERALKALLEQEGDLRTLARHLALHPRRRKQLRTCYDALSWRSPLETTKLRRPMTTRRLSKRHRRRERSSSRKRNGRACGASGCRCWLALTRMLRSCLRGSGPLSGPTRAPIWC